MLLDKSLKGCTHFWPSSDADWPYNQNLTASHNYFRLGNSKWLGTEWNFPWHMKVYETPVFVEAEIDVGLSSALTGTADTFLCNALANSCLTLFSCSLTAFKWADWNSFNTACLPSCRPQHDQNPKLSVQWHPWQRQLALMFGCQVF